MLEAAILAPSWKNSQVTRYYVVTGEKMLEKVKETLPEFNRKNVQDAPVLIVSAIIRIVPDLKETGRLPTNWETAGDIMTVECRV